MNPAVEAAVLETARGGILRDGLAFDRCDVAVVTNIGEGDHLGLGEVNTPEELAKVKRCIVDVVPPDGIAVLNANDPLVVGMAPHCAGGILYFALDGNHPVIVRHRAAGGKAIFVRDEPDRAWPKANAKRSLLSLDRVPLTHGGKIAFQVENTLAAVAAAWALKVPVGRDPRPGGVVRRRHGQGARPLQPAGNPRGDGDRRLRAQSHALAALIEAIEQFPNAQRHVRLLDRRRPPRLRHAPPGRTAGRGLRPRDPVRGPLHPRPRRRRDHPPASRGHGRRAARVKQIEEIRGAVKAVEAALRSAQPGDCAGAGRHHRRDRAVHPPLRGIDRAGADVGGRGAGVEDGRAGGRGVRGALSAARWTITSWLRPRRLRRSCPSRPARRGFFTLF